MTQGVQKMVGKFSAKIGSPLLSTPLGYLTKSQFLSVKLEFLCVFINTQMLGSSILNSRGATQTHSEKYVLLSFLGGDNTLPWIYAPI